MEFSCPYLGPEDTSFFLHLQATVSYQRVAYLDKVKQYCSQTSQAVLWWKLGREGQDWRQGETKHKQLTFGGHAQSRQTLQAATQTYMLSESAVLE